MIVHELQAIVQFLMRFEIIEETRIGVYAFETESQTCADQNYGRRQYRKRARPKSVGRFGFDNFAFARNGPAQKRRIHQVSAAKRDDGAEHAAKAELPKRFCLYY